MKTKGKYKHRGEVLHSAVNKSHISITQLVKRMHISRSSFYNHVQDPELSFDLLERYGGIIDYDFSNDFPEMQKNVFSDPAIAYGEPKTMEEAIKQRNYWKDKYLNQLEKYNKLIEEKMG